jgi:RNA polymerase sigma factor (sigma-70 family)
LTIRARSGKDGFLNAEDPLLEPVRYAPGSTTIWNNSWRNIYDHFKHAILAYARQSGLNDHSAEDVLQEVMTTVIRSQHGQEAAYDRGAGSFQAWLWGVIRNRVRSQRRKDHREAVFSPVKTTGADGETRLSLPELPQAPPDFEGMEEDQWQRALLAAALRKVQERVTGENFAIYTALLEDKAGVEELARRHGKEPNAIYAVKHRCEKILVSEARVLRQAWEGLRQIES